MTLNYEEEDFEFQKMLSDLKRQFKILTTSQSVLEKKSAMKEIEDYLEEYKLDLEPNELDIIMKQFSKDLLQAFSDKSDKIRETSIKIYTDLLSRMDNLDPQLKYTFSILTARTNCYDLDGIQGLDEKMLPAEGQKPKKMTRIVEKSEVCRELLLDLFSTLMSCMNGLQMRAYINEAVSLTRVFLMDPFDKIQIKGCRVLSALTTNFTKLCYHFTVILARALLLPLISRKSQVKLVALQALHDVLYCGTWKYTHEVFDVLVGFRDPNVVPIKDFYESSHNYNYFALLIGSKNVVVREAFLRFMGDLLIGLPDRVDIKGRGFAYILTGFFDPHDSIKQSCCEIMEQMGQMIEREKEEDFREQKQMGYESEWTYDGKLSDLPLPSPFKKRPRLGARFTVTAELTKLIHPIRRELKDTIHTLSRYKSSCLLEVLLVFVEEKIVEHLKLIIPVMLKVYNTPKSEEYSQELKAKISSCLSLIGRYCPFKSFNEMLSSYLSNELSQDENMLLSSLIGYKHLIKGYLEALPKDIGLLDKKDSIGELIDRLGDAEWLGNMTRYTLPEYQELFTYVFQTIQAKATEDEMDELIFSRSKKVLRICLTILSIPIFSLVDDSSNQINMKLIKRTIDSKGDVEKDPTAVLIMQILAKLQERSPEIIYDFIEELEDDSIYKDSNDSLTLFSALNMAMVLKNYDLFRDSANRINLSMTKNANFLKPISNMIAYFTFFTKEYYKDSTQRAKFVDVFAHSNLSFLAFHLKEHFKETFEDNEEYDGDNVPRIRNPLFFTLTDLIFSNLKICKNESLEYIDLDTVQDLFLSLAGFIFQEKIEERRLRWMRLFNKLLKNVENPVLSKWIVARELVRDNFKERRRLRRFLFEGEAESELILQVCIRVLFDKYRAMNLEDASATVFTANLEKLMTIYEHSSGKISEENGLEYNYLYLCDLLISICINEKAVKTVKEINQVLVAICKKYKLTFASLLKEAEKKNQPVRLRFLRLIWEKCL